MNRKELINKLNEIDAIASSGDIDRAEKELEECYFSIIKYHFYILLDKYFQIKTTIDNAKGRNDLECFGHFMRLSERIRINYDRVNSSDLLNRLDEVKPFQLKVPQELINIIPITINALYQTPVIISGNNAILSLHITSELPFPININSIVLYFSHDNEIKLEKKIDQIELSKEYKKQIIINVPDAVFHQEIDYILLQISSMSLIIKQDFGSDLTVLPDYNSCKILVTKPQRCIISENIPLQVNISANEIDLEDVEVSIASIEKFNVSVSSAQTISKIDVGTSKIFSFTISSAIPVMTTFVLSVSFQTKKSAKGIMTKKISLDFISPFAVTMHIFDRNFEEVKKPLLDSDVLYMLDTSLRNTLKEPVKITSITSQISDRFGFVDDSDTGIKFDANLPVELESGERLSFIGWLPGGRHYDVLVKFESIEGKYNFTFKTPKSDSFKTHDPVTFSSPEMVVIGQNIDCYLTINRTSSNSSQLSKIDLSIEQKPQFLINGPIKKRIFVPSGSIHKVPIQFIGVEAGAQTLPAISVVDADGAHSKFIEPILVSFH